MSFRLFVYYCAICGGWAALLGWIVGLPIVPGNDDLRRAGIFGLSLGLLVALGLSLVDSMWSLGLRKWVQVFMRVFVAMLVGGVGGLIGGILGQILYVWSPYLFVVGWTITGLLVGTSIGTFEVLASLVSQKDVRGSSKKLIKCLVGGTMGGLLGGILAQVMRQTMGTLFPTKESTWLWSPTALGFVALGMCIGLLVGLAQIILKEAWIKVEAGFRAGREMIVAKEKTSIGRAEACDIGLFGDPTIEKMHAYIIMKGNNYFLEDAQTPGGTFINDVKVVGQSPLRSGDLIRIGKSLLRFYEKPKGKEKGKS